jgi:hypothetical protein
MKYTAEISYDLPVFVHRTIEADSPAEACEKAIEIDDWSGERFDYESAGPNRVTGLWLGENAAYEGEAVPTPPEPIVATYDGVRAVVQHHFDEAAAAIMSGIPGDTAPEMQVAIDAAIDLLAKAMLDIRIANAP